MPQVAQHSRECWVVVRGQQHKCFHYLSSSVAGEVRKRALQSHRALRRANAGSRPARSAFGGQLASFSCNAVANCRIASAIAVEQRRHGRRVGSAACTKAGNNSNSWHNAMNWHAVVHSNGSPWITASVNAAARRCGDARCVAAEDQLVLAVQATEFTNQHAVAVGIVPANQALDRSHTIVCTTGMQRPGKQRHNGPVSSRCQHFAGYVPTSRHVRPHQKFLFKVTAAVAGLPSLPYRLISQVIGKTNLRHPYIARIGLRTRRFLQVAPLKQELQSPLPQAKLKSRLLRSKLPHPSQFGAPPCRLCELPLPSLNRSCCLSAPSCWRWRLPWTASTAPGARFPLIGGEHKCRPRFRCCCVPRTIEPNRFN